MNDKIKNKLKTLPESSGVYIMRDKGGDIIYIGKAVVLKNRVRQYFNNSPKEPKVSAMVENIDSFDYIITLTEKDALALEANLIRKYKPHYNILLKDDKSSPYIRIDLKQSYPAIEITRKVKRDGARYFGPYFNGISVHSLADVVRDAFKVRTCGHKMPKRSRVCLNYHIGLCSGPCMGYVSPEEYRESINSVMRFLEGRDDTAEKLITEKMEDAAANEEFERAIGYRDKLEMLKRLKERTVAALGTVRDIDFFSFVSGGGSCVMSVSMVRGSKLMGVKNYIFLSGALSDSDTLISFITQYYGGNNEIPQEVCLEEPGDYSALKEFLEGISGRKTEITVPVRGSKKRLIRTTRANASDYLEKSLSRFKTQEEMTHGACETLKKILSIKSARRIECYDISNISGVDKVASQSVFIDGKPAKKEYRKYRIKDFEGADDFRSMKETLERRFKRAADGDEKFSELPDLIVIDGGKGQLSSAYAAMKETGYDVPMVGLAKREEEIYTVGSPLPIILSRDNYALRLLQRVRDEAHRFAITYHRTLRSKRYGSVLDGVKGIGKKRRDLIVKAFPDFEKLKAASPEEIAAVNGIDKTTAQNVYDFFRTEKF